MELRRYLAIVRGRILLLLLVVLVAMGAAYLATPKSKNYTASTVIYVGATSYAATGTDQLRYDPTLIISQLMGTYSEMLKSAPIAQAALDLTHVPRSPGQVVAESTISPGKDTQLLTVVVRDPDPVIAQQLSNGISDAFVAKAKQFQGGREGSLPSVPAYIFERATTPEAADGTGLVRNLALAGFFGLLIGIGIALLLDHLDMTLKSPREAESRLQLPALGFIPFNSMQAAGVPSPVAHLSPWAKSRPSNGT